MKVNYLITLIAVFCISLNVQSQSFEQIDQKVLQYEDSLFSCPEDLAKKINADFTESIHKARAIYTWITHHIAYDIEKYKKPSQGYSYTYSSQEEKIRKKRQLL